MLLRETYNGWKNRQTWNVALWINNDERLYKKAVKYVKNCKQSGVIPTYNGFIDFARLDGCKTPDGVYYDARRIDFAELDAMLQELE